MNEELAAALALDLLCLSKHATKLTNVSEKLLARIERLERMVHELENKDEV